MGKRLVIIIQNASLCAEDMIPGIERGCWRAGSTKAIRR